MIKSMTGFGRMSQDLENKKINVEIRSLNSKQLDLNTRIYSAYREKELELRSKVGKFLGRGKSELNIYVEENGKTSSLSFNHELASNYHKELKSLADNIGESSASLLHQVLKMPDVMTSSKVEITDSEWKILFDLVDATLEKFDAFRIQEGAKLEKDFTSRVENILGFLNEIINLEKERIDTIKDRIFSNLKAVQDKVTIDQNRFEQELIYYLEKLDITEEKVRLKAHCEYFMETMKQGDSQGKKLGFITQEIGREINTIGSKSNHSEIQRNVVQMKDELEKIKEQILNIL